MAHFWVGIDSFPKNVLKKIGFYFFFIYKKNKRIQIKNFILLRFLVMKLICLPVWLPVLMYYIFYIVFDTFYFFFLTLSAPSIL